MLPTLENSEGHLQKPKPFISRCGQKKNAISYDIYDNLIEFQHTLDFRDWLY